MKLVSVYDIANVIGHSHPHGVQATLNRNGVMPVQKSDKRLLYDIADVAKVEAWRGIIESHTEELNAVCIRKQRSDRGLPRGVSQVALQAAVAIAKNLYLSSGMPDLRFACESALKLLVVMAERGETSCTAAEAAAIKPEWFYGRWVRRRDKYFLGPYHAEGWEELWRQAYKQHDAALYAPHASRKVWQIFENAGWAGEGYGFGFMVCLDDRSADVYVAADGKPSLPNAIYVWEVLTGALLFVEPCTQITTQAYVRAILGAVFLHGLEKAPLIVLENAKAAKSVRITDLVEALYTESDLQRIWGDTRLHKLTHGQRGPVYRNVPHIARDFGKAFAERSFGTVKREHDAAFSPDTFQGANRSTAVQLHRSNQPWWFGGLTHPRHPVATTLPSESSYYASLFNWSQTDYLDRDRSSLREWAREKGLKPRRRDMMLYYGGGITQDGQMQLSYERFAMAVFLAQPRTSRVTLRHPGRLRVIMDGREINLISAELGPDLVNRTCGVAPVPTVANQYIVVLMRWQKNSIERFVCIAEDMTATTAEQAAEQRTQVRSVREHLGSRIDAAVREARAPAYQERRRECQTMIAQPQPQVLKDLPSSDSPEEVEYVEEVEIVQPTGNDEVARIMEL